MIKQWLLNWLGVYKETWVPYHSYSAKGGLIDAQGDKSKMLGAYQSWVYACIAITAKAVSQAKFRLYSGTDELDGHPLIRLLENPNPYETKMDFLYKLITHKKLTGNAYVYTPRNGLGERGEMWLLQPDRMTIFPSEKDFISHYEWKNLKNETVKFSKDEIIHFKYPNPSDPYYGASVLMAASYSSDIDTFQHTYQRNFYKNGAAIQGVLQTDHKLNQDTYQRLKEQWNSRYAGEENAGKTAILEAGLKYNPIGISPKDLDWLASNRITRDEICAIFGVPAALLGLVEDVNRANGETQEYTFHRQVVEPDLKMIEQQLTKSLAGEYEGSLHFEHDSTIPYDDLRAAQAARERIQAGMTTPNDESEELGWGRSDNALADERWMPLNYAPLSKQGEQQ